MENNEYAFLEEYKSLRGEIVQNQNLRIVLLASVITATGVVVGFPFKLEKAEGLISAIFPSIALLLIVIVGIAITYYLSKNIIFISSYIKMRFELDSENQGQLQWETRIYHYKEIEKKEKEKNHVRRCLTYRIIKDFSPKASVTFGHIYSGLIVAVFIYSISRWLLLYNFLRDLSSLDFYLILSYPTIIMLLFMFIIQMALFYYSVFHCKCLRDIGNRTINFTDGWKKSFEYDWNSLFALYKQQAVSDKIGNSEIEDEGRDRESDPKK